MARFGFGDREFCIHIITYDVVRAYPATYLSLSTVLRLVFPRPGQICTQPAKGTRTLKFCYIKVDSLSHVWRLWSECVFARCLLGSWLVCSSGVLRCVCVVRHCLPHNRPSCRLALKSQLLQVAPL